MREPRLALLLAFLAVLLVATYGLSSAGRLYIVGGAGTLVGDRLALVLVLFFLTATAASVLPGARETILLAATLLQLFVLFRPHQVAGALAVWTAFYFLVQTRASWWLKGWALAGFYAAPLLLARLAPGSSIEGSLLVAHFASNFILRSFLYAYESGMKRDQLRGAGLPGFLLYLAAPPLTAVKLAPIGFTVLHRGLRRDVNLDRLARGISEMALGVLYLAAREITIQAGLLPAYRSIADAAGELTSLTALAASQLLLARLFFDVAGHVHLAVGMLRVLGFDIPTGSDRPYESRNVLEFWRRWNTYYRDYLVTLGYYPVARLLRRRYRIAVVAGGAAAFVLSGLTHSLQIFMRHPAELSLRRFLEAQVWALIYGFLVVAWMIKDAVREREGGRSPRSREPRPLEPVFSFRRVGFTLGTMSIVGLVLLPIYPVLTGEPLAGALAIFAAVFRAGG